MPAKPNDTAPTTDQPIDIVNAEKVDLPQIAEPTISVPVTVQMPAPVFVQKETLDTILKAFRAIAQSLDTLLYAKASDAAVLNKTIEQLTAVPETIEDPTIKKEVTECLDLILEIASKIHSATPAISNIPTASVGTTATIPGSADQGVSLAPTTANQAYL